MKKITRYIATILLGAGLLAGCSGSSGSPQSSITGKVADGYLVNALVFLDKNSNYQLDVGEPSTATDSTGSFTLNIDPADVGKYPIVALAIKDQTTDLDNLSVKLGNTYVLSMHALAITPPTSGMVTGTASNFISPISTLIRETLVANPLMTLADASVQVRNQLNLPPEINIHHDYVFGSMSGAHKPDYQKVHQVAQQMAGLMGEQAGTVMNGNRPVTVMNGIPEKYRAMIGNMGSYLPQITEVITDHGAAGGNMTSMGIRDLIHSVMGPPVNAPPLFNNYTSRRSFWNMSGLRMMARSPHH